IDCFQSASRQLSLQTGASVTIPCLYDKEYIQHKKYWCYDASNAYNYCTIQAYANNTQGKVTVTDNPAESLFTVTMNNLQTGDTGSYWCVVERGGIFQHDVTEQLHITVKAVPDLSVNESRVRGEEGGSVTVQCLYSAAYRNTQKQWCRFKDKNCNIFQKSETSQNSAVQLSDDGRSFSVEMSRLKKSDAGWYWCSAGDLQVPVHISLTDPLTGTATAHHVSTYISVAKHDSVAPLTAASSSDKTISVSTHISASVTKDSSSEKTIWSDYLIYMMVLVFLLVLLVIILICILKKKHKAKNQIRTTPSLTAEDSIMYSTVSALKSSKSKASKGNKEDVTYSSVRVAPKEKTVSPDDVDDKTIYHSVVCKSSSNFLIYLMALLFLLVILVIILICILKKKHRTGLLLFIIIIHILFQVSPNDDDDKIIYSSVIRK
ncbi:CMRF35-like molecule 1, partial [Clarias magur]